jgi:hypothetical protein
MNGALMTASSRFAIAAALGLVVGVGSARAADLGGNCCADLEERVAELEATTARKGNRKMSLTITGQVNRLIMAWDDGHTRGIFYGIDSVNSSSRFSFLGEAAATPWLKFGFEIMIEGEGTSASNRVSQLNEDGSFSATTYFTPFGNGAFNNASNSDSFFGDARRVAAWVEHKEIGRLTVGRYESAGAMGTIDLGGVGAATGFGSVALNQGNFFLRLKDGSIMSSVWSSFLDPAAYQGRTELLRYDSPAIHGFIFSASINESSGGLIGGNNYGVMLRYAGEHNGFRIAAGVGFEHIGDVYTNQSLALGTTATQVTLPGLNLVPSTCLNGSGAATATAGANAASLTCKTPDVNAWGVALSAMHIHTGLFLQGAIQGVEYINAGSSTSAYWGETCGSATAGGSIVAAVAVPGGTCNPKADAWWWQLQGGIAKNWTGWGNTVLYGEYSKLFDFGGEVAGRNFTSGTASSTNGFAQMSNVTSSIATVWGIGLVQNFNNAATEWYFAYRNFALEVNSDAVCTRAVGTPNIATSAPTGPGPCNISDFNLFTTGLRVKF